jgi:hexosaminidase
MTMTDRIPHRTSLRAIRLAVAALTFLSIGAAATAQPARQAATHTIIPAPASIQLTAERFPIEPRTIVVIDRDAPADVERIGRMFTEMLGLAARRDARRLAAGEAAPAGSVHLRLVPGRTALGAEGYELTVGRERVTVTAGEPAGLFYGMQTVRQLMPAGVEHPAAIGRGLSIAGGQVRDVPRYEWRGMMLDVSRHFLPLEDVKRFIDYLALYKMNRLHLHLSDDQGWRIEIKSWPNLTKHGGSTEVGGGEGGFYTQAQFADLVAYATARQVTIVPEIDMPGHTNAALASYAVLNCDGKAPALYTGTRVGFSTLCVERDTVYAFVDDVVREIGALVPTPYFHIGGDEVEKLTDEQYRAFIQRVQGIVERHGKRMIGWGEIAPATLTPTTILQHWKDDQAQLHVARGGKVILSPSSRLYLDMKYDSTTVLGLKWAGLIPLRHAYEWDPSTFRQAIPDNAILGVEGPLWSETLERREEFEHLAFPRLLAIAELGWSPREARGWTGFRRRLAAHGERLEALGVNFYRAPEVDWR